jgi:hypothetical protein
MRGFVLDSFSLTHILLHEIHYPHVSALRYCCRIRCGAAPPKNASDEHPESVARLTRQLADGVANGRSTPGTKQANDANILILKSNQANGR